MKRFILFPFFDLQNKFHLIPNLNLENSGNFEILSKYKVITVFLKSIVLQSPMIK